MVGEQASVMIGMLYFMVSTLTELIATFDGRYHVYLVGKGMDP